MIAYIAWFFAGVIVSWFLCSLLTAGKIADREEKVSYWQERYQEFKNLRKIAEDIEKSRKDKHD